MIRLFLCQRKMPIRKWPWTSHFYKCTCLSAQTSLLHVLMALPSYWSCSFLSSWSLIRGNFPIAHLQNNLLLWNQFRFPGKLRNSNSLWQFPHTLHPSFPDANILHYRGMPVKIKVPKTSVYYHELNSRLDSDFTSLPSSPFSVPNSILTYPSPYNIKNK